MGAVRVKVKLSNGADEYLVRVGQLRPEQVRSYEADALVDSGSMGNIIPVHVMQLLGLPASGRTVAKYADGREAVVDVTTPLTIRIFDRTVTGDALVLGDEVLIGQIALEGMDLYVDCRNQRLVPNPAHPDQPVFRV